jgi:hypothetical protein
MKPQHQLADLSRFHTIRPPGKPYLVFDPKGQAELNGLTELYISDVEETAIREGHEALEKSGGPDPLGAQWPRIYTVRNADTDQLVTTNNGEWIYIFFTVFERNGRHESGWDAFLCRPEHFEVLAQDQEP